MTGLTNKTVKTRKFHQCVSCGEWISVGDKAQYRAYIFEGDFNSDYLHPECHEAMKTSLDLDDLKDGFDFGMFERGEHCEKGELVKHVEKGK